MHVGGRVQELRLDRKDWEDKFEGHEQLTNYLRWLAESMNLLGKEQAVFVITVLHNVRGVDV